MEPPQPEGPQWGWGCPEEQDQWKYAEDTGAKCRERRLGCTWRYFTGVYGGSAPRVYRQMLTRTKGNPRCMKRIFQLRVIEGDIAVYKDHF